MIKAIVRSGVLVPHNPLPDDWTDGTEVDVDRSNPSDRASDEIDRWLAELNAIASQGDPADDQLLETALAERQREQKELAHKKAGMHA
jgi:hypothetical protein